MHRVYEVNHILHHNDDTCIEDIHRVLIMTFNIPGLVSGFVSGSTPEPPVDLIPDPIFDPVPDLVPDSVPGIPPDPVF